MRIAMARGDIHWERFLINNPDGSTSDLEFDNIYFTVKKTKKDKQFIFQKSTKDGTIVKLGPGDYQFKIEPEDTNNMVYGEYYSDIQVGYRNLLKETFPITFVLMGEATWAANE